MYEPITHEEVKYLSKEKLVNYIAELEWSVMELHEVIDSITYTTSKLSQQGIILDKKIMEVVIKKAYEKSWHNI